MSTYKWPEKCKACQCHTCGRWEDCDVGDQEYVWPCKGCTDKPYMPVSGKPCKNWLHPDDDLADQAAVNECKRCFCYTCSNWAGCTDLANKCTECSRGYRHKPTEEPECPGYERQPRGRKNRKARIRRDGKMRQKLKNSDT